MPTIIQVNNKSFKYHDQPLIAFLEEPLESLYYIRNPETSDKKSGPKVFKIEKKEVEIAIKMKVLPICKYCGRTLDVTKIEPYINENYRISFQCQNTSCGKDRQTLYYESLHMELH